MQTLVHADIFFFISTVALVIISIGIAIGMYYAIGVLRDIKEISARINKASEGLERDLDGLRSAVKAEGNKVKGTADLVLGFVIRSLTPKIAKRKKPKAVEVEEETE